MQLITSRISLFMFCAVAFLVAVSASCKNDDTSSQTPNGSIQAEATARPTITPVPTATSTPGPSPTPSPTATPTATPRPTSTPSPPKSHMYEMGRLFAEMGVDFSTLFVSKVGNSQWPTKALGCPEIGTYYDTADAPYIGTYYFLSNGKIEWEYHVDAQDTYVIRCSERTSPIPLVNVTENANLRTAGKLSLMRRNFTTNTFEFIGQITPEDKAKVIEIFDQPASISEAPSCETVFRLDFETNEGKQEIEFICANDYQSFDIYWNGLHGIAPPLGNIVGQYLTGNPVPTLPTAKP